MRGLLAYNAHTLGGGGSRPPVSVPVSQTKSPSRHYGFLGTSPVLRLQPPQGAFHFRETRRFLFRHRPEAFHVTRMVLAERDTARVMSRGHRTVC